MRICLFTDTLGDLNGVSRFIQDMGELAASTSQAEQLSDSRLELIIVTSTSKALPKADYIHNLEYSFRMPMPFYQELDLVWCKKSKIRNLLAQFKPDLVHISTPGPFGWRAKSVAEKLGYPLVGTYHTDFPAYLYDLTYLRFVKRLTDKVMARFYRPFGHVFSRSEAYREIMASDIGLGYEQTSVLTAGTNLQKFHPDFRDPAIWHAFGLNDKRIKVFYVGRINVEKNIPFMVEVWQAMREQHPQIKADLVLVGEGRYRKWADQLRSEHIYFLGPVVGENLSKLYASSDLFLFPSVTDTLGQVIMEAQASGVGCLVSDLGGPQTLVEHDQTGWVLKADDRQIWVDALAAVLQDATMRETWGKRAHQHMQSMDIMDSFYHFIEQHQS